MHRRNLIALAGLILVPASLTAAEVVPPPAPDATPQRQAKPVATIVSVAPGTFALGDALTFEVTGLENLCPDRTPDQKLRLFLNGRALPGIVGEPEAANRLRFKLEPIWALEETDGEPNVWAKLVSGSLLRNRVRKVQASLGYEACADGAGVQTPPKDLQFVVLRDAWLWTWVASMVVIVGLTFWLGRRTPLLREKGAAGPFSLARVQMAFWTVLALGAFLLILVSTGFVASLSNDVLTLLGISAATGLGAAVVDAGKEAQVERKTMLERQSKALDRAAQSAGGPTSEMLEQQRKVAVELAQVPALVGQTRRSFFADILQDENGYSIYRLQFVLWTLVLGGYFLYAVVSRLIMPSFGPQLLTLMGLSSGTYVSLKTQEKQV